MAAYYFLVLYFYESFLLGWANFYFRMAILWTKPGPGTGPPSIYIKMEEGLFVVSGCMSVRLNVAATPLAAPFLASWFDYLFLH